MNGWTCPLMCLVVAAVVVLSAGGAHAQDEASKVSALLRDLQDPDFDKAHVAAQELERYPRQSARIVPALIEAIKTRDWNRCGADVRDAIAWSLGGLKAKEAVVPLLEVVKSGKPIEHECVE